MHFYLIITMKNLNNLKYNIGRYKGYAYRNALTKFDPLSTTTLVTLFVMPYSQNILQIIFVIT